MDQHENSTFLSEVIVKISQFILDLLQAWADKWTNKHTLKQLSQWR